jgi:hypothetical protein
MLARKNPRQFRNVLRPGWKSPISRDSEKRAGEILGISRNVIIPFCDRFTLKRTKQSLIRCALCDSFSFCTIPRISLRFIYSAVLFIITPRYSSMLRFSGTMRLIDEWFPVTPEAKANGLCLFFVDSIFTREIEDGFDWKLHYRLLPQNCSFYFSASCSWESLSLTHCGYMKKQQQCEITERR